MEDEEKTITNIMKLSEQDLDLLKRFVKGESLASLGIIKKLLSIEKRYGLSRDDILMIFRYLRLHQE